MNRHAFINLVVRPSLSLLFVAHLLAVPVDAADRPNIVFIMADDLGYGDLGCYGQKLIQTPNIDRLAMAGTRFTQAYAGGPVCAASRAVLMTGLHNGHAPARDNIPHYPSYLRDEDITVAEVLQGAGYRCGGVGKWSLGDAGTEGRATNQGFDSWFGYLNQDHAHHYYTDYLDDDEGRLELPDNHKSRNRYSHHLLTERALKFIREADRDEPFFFYAAYTLPHFSSKKEDEHGLAVPSTDPYANRKWDERSKKYAAMLHMLDQDVGRIVDLIDERGLAENTLVIFTSDNGGHARVAPRFKTSGPLRGYKRSLNEGGIRVPFIARWPGNVPANQTSDSVIAFQDMLPTFADLAGVAPPQAVDGQSVVRALKGHIAAEREGFLYWDYGHCRLRYDQAVRWRDWKGVRLGRTSEIQLYNLSTDIGEAHDVADSHPDVVKRLAGFMESAPTKSERYPVGKLYRGGPIWKPARVAETVLESEAMLAGRWLPKDPHQIDYEKLPRVPSKHAIISDVRDKAGSRVHQHAYLAHHDGRFWAMWSDGPGLPRPGVTAEQHRNLVPGHDRPDTRNSFATSKDGLRWSKPADLTGPPRIEGYGWIARGLWKRDGELLALASHFNAPGYAGRGLSLEAFRWNGTKWAAHGTVLDDSMNNFPPKRLPSGEWMMTRRDHRRQVSVMIGGTEAFNQWRVNPLAAHDGNGRPEEPYWHILHDGRTIVGLIRDNGGSKFLLRTFSRDNGKTWSKIRRTNFPDATSKFFVHRTSRGYYVMVSNSNPRRRDPLTLAISRDGLVFNKLFWLVGGRHVDYPHIIEHDGHLLIAFSGAKQTMEVMKVSLDELERLSMPATVLARGRR